MGYQSLPEGYWSPTEGKQSSREGSSSPLLFISVRTRGQLMVTSVIQGPGYNFASEDPTIFLEDANITTGERVARPRQYPQVLLSSAPTLGAGQVGDLSMQDIQRLHQTTGEILAWAGQQQQQQPQPSSVIQCPLHLFPLLAWIYLPLKLALKMSGLPEGVKRIC